MTISTIIYLWHKIIVVHIYQIWLIKAKQKKIYITIIKQTNTIQEID